MKARSHIRESLREATGPVHNRLHAHEGLAAVATGMISKAEYEQLLMRLFGFHEPFDSLIETVAGPLGIALNIDGRKRAAHIAEDLETLGFDAQTIACLPRKKDLFRPGSAAEFMGAMYVVEGSTLGGLQLARALKPLFGMTGTEGRRFFCGYGERHAAMWQEFLHALDSAASNARKEEEIIHGALRTFDDFERWMNDWRQPAIVAKVPARSESSLERAR